MIPVMMFGGAAGMTALKGAVTIAEAVKFANAAGTVTKIGKSIYDAHQDKKKQDALRTEHMVEGAAIMIGIGVIGYAGKKLIEKYRRASEKEAASAAE